MLSSTKSFLSGISIPAWPNNNIYKSRRIVRFQSSLCKEYLYLNPSLLRRGQSRFPILENRILHRRLGTDLRANMDFRLFRMVSITITVPIPISSWTYYKGFQGVKRIVHKNICGGILRMKCRGSSI